MRLILSRLVAMFVPVVPAMARQPELTESIGKVTLQSRRRCSGGLSFASNIRHDECSCFIAPTPWIHQCAGVSPATGKGEGSSKIDFHPDEGRQTGNIGAATKQVAMRAIFYDRNVRAMTIRRTKRTLFAGLRGVRAGLIPGASKDATASCPARNGIGHSTLPSFAWPGL
jgi:hypothetical protein